jgi:hypothetical protein
MGTLEGRVAFITVGPPDDVPPNDTARAGPDDGRPTSSAANPPGRPAAAGSALWIRWRTVHLIAQQQGRPSRGLG